jgi:hypothetical protein
MRTATTPFSHDSPPDLLRRRVPWNFSNEAKRLTLIDNAKRLFETEQISRVDLERVTGIYMQRKTYTTTCGEHHQTHMTPRGFHNSDKEESPEEKKTRLWNSMMPKKPLERKRYDKATGLVQAPRPSHLMKAHGENWII